MEVPKLYPLPVTVNSPLTVGVEGAPVVQRYSFVAFQLPREPV